MANSGGHAAPAVKADINWVYIKDTQNTNDGTPIMVHRKEVTDVSKPTAYERTVGYDPKVEIKTLLL